MITAKVENKEDSEITLNLYCHICVSFFHQPVGASFLGQ